MSYISKFLVFTGIIFGLFGGFVAFDTNSATLHATTLTGIVIDENGDEIANASVTVNRELLKIVKKSVVADLDGFYKIDGIGIGNWEINVSSVGYESEMETIQIKRGATEVEKNFTLNFEEFVKINNTDVIDTAVAAFKTIGTLRKEDPINADDIAFEYEGELQELTQQVDSEFGFGLDSDVLAAIEDIRNDNEPKLAAQVIDKTIQRVFFLTVLDRITEVHNDFDDETTEELGLKWDEAFAAFQAIIGTADRENKVLTEDRLSIEMGGNPNLEDQITVALIRGKEALDKKDEAEDKISIGIQRQVIRLSLVRAFYIGVLREVEGIISNRDSDVEEAMEKQKEGEVFYSIIETFISRDNSTGNGIIKSQLTGDVSGVVADQIVSEMNRGFTGRARGELDANESKFSDGDRGEAMVVAEEAFLYTNVFLADLELRLGTDKRNEVEGALKDLKQASNDSDASKASEARQTIFFIISTYENELFLIVLF